MTLQTIICAGGTLHPDRQIQQAIEQAELIIAADSGAHIALAYHRTPDILVGDLDSLEPSLIAQLRQQKVRIIQAPVEKDETDTELAIQIALEQGASAITLLGAFGGERVEHSLANVFLLTGYPHFPIRILDGATACWLLSGPGETQIHGQKGDLLSLFPLQGDARGVTSSHLYYALNHDTLHIGKPRGISNVLTADHASVVLQEGMLLVIHKRAPAAQTTTTHA